MIRYRSKFLLCDECPIGQESIYARRNRLKSLDDWQPEYCSCDKIGEDHFWIGGWCEDAFTTEPMVHSLKKKSKYKQYNKYFRNKKYKQNKLIHINTDFEYVSDTQNYFNQICRSKNGALYTNPLNMSGIHKLCKRQTNKIVRHRNDVPNFNSYRKYFDYWKMMFKDEILVI